MKTYLRKLYFQLLRHSRIWLILCAVLLLGSGIVISCGKFSNDIARMLPAGSESMKIYRKTADSNFFNKVMVLFSAEEAKHLDDPSFHKKFRLLAKRLAAKKEYFTKVDSELFTPTDPEAQKKILLYALSLTAPESLPGPERLVRNVTRQLVMLSSTGRSEMIRLDPANLSGKLYQPLLKFRQITGHAAALDSPFMMTKDHKNLLLVLDTPLSPSDPRSGRLLEKVLTETLRNMQIPPGITYELILPHRRAVANEKVVKKDVRLAMILSVILFSLITIFLYRGDWRSFFILLLPAGASLAGGALVVILFDQPQFYVLGLGGVIVSIALDYGIHIYSGMKTRMPYRTLFKLMPSLLIGMATSAAACFMFVFSSMEAVRQLGVFAGSSLCCSLLLMFLVLPGLLRKGRGPQNIGLQNLFSGKNIPFFMKYIFILLWGVSALLLGKLQFRADVRQYDLSPESLRKQEEKVNLLFQSGKHACAALFEGRTAQEALQKSARFAAREGFFTLAELIPGETIRRENFAKWKSFPLAEYKDRLKKESMKAGFGEKFFDPFLEILEKGKTAQGPLPVMPDFLQALRDRFLLKGKSGSWYSAAMYDEAFADKNFPDLNRYAVILSREYVPRVMAQDIMKGVLPGACAALLAVLLLTACYFRSLYRALLAMLPAGSALLVTGGIFALTGKAINLPITAGCVILCGLSVDYGIFVLHALQNDCKKLIFHSVTLSAITTLCGGLTVAFTDHPILRDGGLTLICGITVTWATALFFLPLCLRKKEKTP